MGKRRGMVTDGVTEEHGITFVNVAGSCKSEVVRERKSKINGSDTCVVALLVPQD
jgi:hypothetical protein